MAGSETYKHPTSLLKFKAKASGLRGQEEQEEETHMVENSALISAYRGVRQERLPIWFMRQAGRSLPEYKQRRGDSDMMQACLDPEMVRDITLQPVQRHGVDAAIFFSDIVVPLFLAGLDVSIVPGRGPVFAEPIRSAKQIDALPELNPESLEPIRQAAAATVAALENTPLIGFAGAPFTLAAYLVEGGPSREHLAARGLMKADPESWRKLLSWTAEVSGAFLAAQIESGAQAIQLFDSWVGSLSVRDYREHVAFASKQTLDAVRHYGVPMVHFGVGTGELLTELKAVGADVIGVDWRLPLSEANRRLGGGVPLQGNIDPALLTAPWEVLSQHVREVVAEGKSAPAHVVNLGHGVPPDTDPGVLTRIVELVHSL